MTFTGCVSLGIWQLRRHAWREAVLAEADARIDLPPVPIAEALAEPEGHRDRRAEVRGRFLPEDSITVFSLTPVGEEGVKVLTPLAIEGAAPDAPVLLIDRGFVPAAGVAAFLERDRSEVPGEVALVGRVVPLALQDVAPGSAAAPRREWLRFDGARPDTVAALQAQLPRPLAPVALEAAEGPRGALPRGGITRPVSPVSHLGYAIFWLGVAAGAVLTWVGIGRQRPRDAEREARRARLTRPGNPDGEGGRP